MDTESEPERKGTTLIKEQLRRSFHDKASEEIPSDLMSLIQQLREQDEQNGK